MTATARGRHARRERVLTTLLFSEVTDGEGEPRGARLETHDGAVRRVLEIFGGRELKVSGGGFSATFDIPVDGVRCAIALGKVAAEMGLCLRTGLHTGEIELRGGDACGEAVQLCRRLLDVARPGEIVVTELVSLLAGPQVRFLPRGPTGLDGVRGTFFLLTATPDPRAGRTVTSTGSVALTKASARSGVGGEGS